MTQGTGPFFFILPSRPSGVSKAFIPCYNGPSPTAKSALPLPNLRPHLLIIDALNLIRRLHAVQSQQG